MDRIAEIKGRHDVSAPFQGDPVGSKASYNQAREDRAVLLAEVDRLRLRLSAILTWPANWTAPWESEGEWRGDLELAKAALRGDPE